MTVPSPSSSAITASSFARPSAHGAGRETTAQMRTDVFGVTPVAVTVDPENVTTIGDFLFSAAQGHTKTTDSANERTPLRNLLMRFLPERTSGTTVIEVVLFVLIDRELSH